MKENEIKQSLKETLLKVLYSIHSVISVTIVGSFIDRKGMEGISDIDVIVICKHLNKKVFKQCQQRIMDVSLQECGLKKFRLRINTTFGPLKFDEKNLAVVHLMVYDLAGHYKHVIASPFTCFDWERSDTYVGKSLREIFPVGRLQPRDFVEARRGLDNYLEDLRRGSISIREYKFEKNVVTEIIKMYPLDERHRGEYAFHIVRHLLLNGIKLKYRNNRLFPKQGLEKRMEDLLGEKYKSHFEKFSKLSQLKKQRSKSFPEWTLNWAMEFAEDFQKAHLKSWINVPTVFFMRHARTSLNDGSFLGQERDPEILFGELSPLPELNLKKVYSSPSKRSIETARIISSGLAPLIDERLQEINYGAVEGWTIEKLQEQHPEIIKAWSKGAEPRFPKGENNFDVAKRLQSFIRNMNKTIDEGKILVVTHNVVLRCLVGLTHAILRKDWHRLSIPYAEPLEFKLKEGILYPNISREKLGQIFEGLREV